MIQIRLGFASVATFLVLTGAGSASAVKPIDPTVGPIAHVTPKTGMVVVAGKGPRCAYGSTVGIKVGIRQVRRSAKGSWNAACVGPRRVWQMELQPQSGRFIPGAAKVVVVSTVRRQGKVISKRRLTRLVKLEVGRGSPLGDYRVDAGVTFKAPKGVKIFVDGGGSGKFGSNCTSEESRATFTSDGKETRRLFGFIAKNGGSCAFEESYSNFHVKWLTPDGLFNVAQEGYFFVGQRATRNSYFATCWSGPSYDLQHMWWVKSVVTCEEPSDLELSLTIK